MFLLWNNRTGIPSSIRWGDRENHSPQQLLNVSAKTTPENITKKASWVIHRRIVVRCWIAQTAVLTVCCLKKWSMMIYKLLLINFMNLLIHIYVYYINFINTFAFNNLWTWIIHCYNSNLISLLQKYYFLENMS